MNPSQLRQACLNHLVELRGQGFQLPHPFDAEQLCQRVGDVVGKPIRLVGVSMPTGAPFGLTFFTAAGHIIAHEQRTSRVHRDHIVAHELGHVLLDHRSFAIDDAAATQLLFPRLRPTMVHRVLSRTGAYSRGEEREAEMMATVLLEETSRPAPPTDGAMSPTDAALHARLRHGLEHPDH